MTAPAIYTPILRYRQTCRATKWPLCLSTASFYPNLQQSCRVTGVSMSEVKNGLYSIRIQMTHGGRGHATGVLVLLDGTIMGGDTHFYYTGFYTFRNGKWRGELTTRQHAEAIGSNPLFGGREVSCGFTGVYSDREAEVDGTALVGKTSVSFAAKLVLKSPLGLDATNGQLIETK
jgi:hypothetical protein